MVADLRLPQVVFYTRSGCHLCDLVKDQLLRLRGGCRFALREIDIDMDEELRQRFNEEVPVVFVEGRKAFKYTLDEPEFLRKIEEARAWRRS